MHHCWKNYLTNLKLCLDKLLFQTKFTSVGKNKCRIRKVSLVCKASFSISVSSIFLSVGVSLSASVPVVFRVSFLFVVTSIVPSIPVAFPLPPSSVFPILFLVSLSFLPPTWRIPSIRWSVLGHHGCQTDGLPERSIPASKPQLTRFLFAPLASSESPWNPALECPLLFEVHEELILVHHQLVGVSPGSLHRTLLLVLDEGVTLGETRHNVPDQTYPADVSKLWEDFLELVLRRLWIQARHEQRQVRVTGHTLVRLVTGHHGPPDGFIVGLHICAIDATRFERVVNIRHRTPLTHHLRVESYGYNLYITF